jgi:hypothetical protein
VHNHLTTLRKLLAFSALLVFVSPILSKLVIIVDFQLNRAFIVENLCVNRNKPAVMCFGQCVLSEQLNEQEQKNEVNLIQANQQVEDLPQWCQELVFPDSPWVALRRPSHIFAYRSRVHQSPVQPAVFHPPEAQLDQL